jgi:hypothetical protein
LLIGTGGVGMKHAGRAQVVPEVGRYLSLKRGMVGENMGGVGGADDQRRRDVGCQAELKRGGEQVDAVATGDAAQGRQLVSLVVGDQRVLLAVIVSWLAANLPCRSRTIG